MQEVLNICISIQKQTIVVIFYLSITYFQFQFLFSVCFCTVPDRMLTINFGIFEWKLSSKNNLSANSEYKRIMYLCTYGIMPIQNMNHMLG